MLEQSIRPARIAETSTVSRRSVAACLGGLGAVLLFGQSSCGGSNSGGSTQVFTESDLVGTWTVWFQWVGRTPGSLTLIVASDYSFQIPASPGVGAATGTLG